MNHSYRAAVDLSIFLVCLTASVTGQTRDYLKAIGPAANNTSSLFRVVAKPGSPSSTSTLVRSDFTGTIRAIEPFDADDGSVVVLAENAAASPPKSNVFRIPSPYLQGPFTPPPTPSFVYVPPPGVRITDLKTNRSEVSGTASILVVEYDPSAASVMVRRLGVAGTSPPFTATAGFIGVDPNTDEIHFVDDLGHYVRMDKGFGLLGPTVTITPAMSVKDAAFCRLPDWRTDPLVVIGTDLATGNEVVRTVDSNGVTVSQIMMGVLNIWSLSVDAFGDITFLGAGGGSAPFGVLVPNSTTTLVPLLPATAGMTALTWTGLHNTGNFNVSPPAFTVRALPALVGNATMDYRLSIGPGVLTGLAYMISDAFCLPCTSLGPNADILVDLTSPAAASITVPVPTTTLFSYTLPVTPSLNGTTWFVQLAGIDTSGALIISDAISQTIGLRPVE